MRNLFALESAEEHPDAMARLLEARPRLVRLCAWLTGDAGAAEDLAQEALLIAWRHLDDLRDPAATDAWLTGIARNVCRRWERVRARERARLVPLGADSPADGDGTAPTAGSADTLADGVDLEIALERDELADLLDRALALLPSSSRQVLVERYLAERGLAEVAERLGLTENAVAVRLHRGKLALRQTLATTFQAEAISYGLLRGEDVGWQVTRLWCPECGQRRLIGRMPAPPANTAFQLRCPACHADPDVYMANAPRDRLMFDPDEIAGYKRLLDRLMAHTEQVYQPTQAPTSVACLRCGQPTAIHHRMPPDTPGVSVHCAACGWETVQGLSGLLLCPPEGRRFWRRHQRIRFLPRRTVEADGRAAFVTSLVSMRTAARLDIVSTMDTHEVLSIHSSGQQAGEVEVDD